MNNRLDNLEIITRSQNTLHSMSSSKLPKAVTQFSLTGIFIAIFPSIKAASEATGTCNAGISKVIRGNQKTSGGFIWRYAQ